MDELTAEQRRWTVGMSRKLSIMKAAGCLIGSGRQSGSQRVEDGGLGRGLFILNFEEGNEVDHKEETTQGDYPQGRGNGSGGWWGPCGESRLPRLLTI